MVSKAVRAAREALADALWHTHDAATWQAALDAYPSHRPDPRTHARYYVRADADPPATLSSLTKADLMAAFEFKQKRGTPRPNKRHNEKNTQAGIDEATAAAEEALEGHGTEPPLPVIEAALAALEWMSGVGAATASILLADCVPSVGLLSDEASATILGHRNYERADVLDVTEALRVRASELGWSVRAVERALWSASRSEEGGGGGGKRAAGGGAGLGASGGVTKPAAKKRK